MPQVRLSVQLAQFNAMPDSEPTYNEARALHNATQICLWCYSVTRTPEPPSINLPRLLQVAHTGLAALVSAVAIKMVNLGDQYQNAAIGWK